MKKLIPLVAFAAALIVAGRQTAAACDLNDADKASIESASNKTFTRDTLPTDGPDYNNMCLSRTLVKLAKQAKDAGQNPLDLAPDLSRKDVPQGMSRFVTSDEYNLVRRLVLTIMARADPLSQSSKA